MWMIPVLSWVWMGERKRSFGSMPRFVGIGICRPLMKTDRKAWMWYAESLWAGSARPTRRWARKVYSAGQGAGVLCNPAVASAVAESGRVLAAIGDGELLTTGATTAAATVAPPSSATGQRARRRCDGRRAATRSA